MKYIDADRLKAEIEKHIKEVKDAAESFTPNQGFFDAKLSGIYDVMAIITSLQQEQPEVELKKEIKEWVNLMVGASFPEQDGDFISEEDYRSVIRQTALHFYELGLKARKEE